MNLLLSPFQDFDSEPLQGIDPVRLIVWLAMIAALAVFWGTVVVWVAT